MTSEVATGDVLLKKKKLKLKLKFRKFHEETPVLESFFEEGACILDFKNT